MYVPTSAPFVRRTRAILRSAEFGFLGVIVDTRVQTPRFCGAPWSAGVLVFSRFETRPLRISWLTVGMSPSWTEKVVYRRKADGAQSPAAPEGHGSKGRKAVNRAGPALPNAFCGLFRFRPPGPPGTLVGRAPDRDSGRRPRRLLRGVRSLDPRQR